MENGVRRAKCEPQMAAHYEHVDDESRAAWASGDTVDHAAAIVASHVSDVHTDRAQASAAWEAMFAAQGKNGTAYADRRYLTLAFPALLDDGITVVEFGCGAGNAMFPVLAANGTAHYVGLDCAQGALALARADARFDASKTRLHHWTAGEDWPDVAPMRPIICLMIFFLSAVPADVIPGLLERIRERHPGARLLIRDYGEYDMTQLRSRPETRTIEGQYVRSDGTLRTFFSLDAMRALLSPHFDIERMDFSMRCLRNRKSNVTMYRRWIHVEARAKRAATALPS